MKTKTEITPKRNMKFLWAELFLRIAVIIIGLYLVFTKVFMIGQVSGMDMFPAVKDGDAYVAFRLNDSYERNDVIVYERDGELRVGRIVGVTNDTVEIRQDGTLRVNGILQEGEITFKTLPPSDEDISYPVANDCYYVLGDYRTHATDSRTLGQIQQSEIRGKIITILRRQSI